MSLPLMLYTLWLPTLLALLLGIVGLLRGFGREAVVSAAIVLGALIVQQWVTPERWAGDLSAIVPSLDPGWIQFSLSLLIIIFTVLFVGYLFGGRLVGRPLSAASRIGGLLLGLLNGSALAGWLLRSAYEGLDKGQASSALYDDQFAQSFMIWAGWFPVALAVLATLVGLLAPLRRAQVVVAQPSPQTDWTPSAPPRTTVSQTTHTASMSPPPPPVAAPGPISYSPVLSPIQPSSRTQAPSETVMLSPADTSNRYTRTESATPASSIPPIAPPQLDSRSPLFSIHDQPTEVVSLVGNKSPFDTVRTSAPPSSDLPLDNNITGPFSTIEASSSSPSSGQINPQERAADKLDSGSPAVTRCTRCGNPLPAHAAFCTACGLRVDT